MATVEWTERCRKCGGVCIVEERLGAWYQAGCMFCGLLDAWDRHGRDVRGKGGVGSAHVNMKRCRSHSAGSPRSRLERRTKTLESATALRRGLVRGRGILSATVVRKVCGGRWLVTRMKMAQPALSALMTTRVALNHLGLKFGADGEPSDAWLAWPRRPLSAWRDRHWRIAMANDLPFGPVAAGTDPAASSEDIPF